ncbi:DNA adenine methylase [Kaistia sp. UC242_56]|uniref:DNA adenine methylase n=1 Tax=Kaistia sp. UC242_56 TaxID=3374625 RepID=UPI0037BD704B
MDLSEFRNINPVQPVAGYIGGKRQLAKRIINEIEAAPHSVYAEPFLGMGGVFLRRRLVPKTEVVNDASGDVATLFRILQRHYQAFMDILKWQLTSRTEFERLAAQEPESLTDLERAARFLYLQRLSFGGKVSGRTFGIDAASSARFDITKLALALKAVHERLSGVWIECLPWQEFIERWDRPKTLFYLDPPYLGTEHVYGRGMFERADHTRLADCLRNIRGRFILSLNDNSEARDLYCWAAIRSVDLTYQVGRSYPRRRAKELIIIGGGGD